MSHHSCLSLEEQEDAMSTDAFGNFFLTHSDLAVSLQCTNPASAEQILKIGIRKSLSTCRLNRPVEEKKS